MLDTDVRAKTSFHNAAEHLKFTNCPHLGGYSCLRGNIVASKAEISRKMNQELETKLIVYSCQHTDAYRNGYREHDGGGHSKAAVADDTSAKISVYFTQIECKASHPRTEDPSEGNKEEEKEKRERGRERGRETDRQTETESRAFTDVGQFNSGAIKSIHLKCVNVHCNHCMLD
ncbi:hypothetical protein Q1695_001302 [Nippostrongylus brasiliensis]|nr:hypothetical protein Q1695_001302 [Nippostrongylus brasiliensis]